MLAHYHGQIWNASEFGRSFGVADTTVRHYLDVLTSALVVRQLAPWHENLGKRQVKAPKVYIADSGLLHTLLGLTAQADVEGHPKVGASWEGFLLEQVSRRLCARPEECSFWAAHSGAELDLLVVRGRQRSALSSSGRVLRGSRRRCGSRWRTSSSIASICCTRARTPSRSGGTSGPWRRRGSWTISRRCGHERGSGAIAASGDIERERPQRWVNLALEGIRTTTLPAAR
jgi:hypothetical protein